MRVEELHSSLETGEIGKSVVDDRLIRKDGRIIWCATSHAPIHDPKGNLRYVLSIRQDISECKRAEEALRESERLFRGSFENASVGILILSADRKNLWG